MTGQPALCHLAAYGAKDQDMALYEGPKDTKSTRRVSSTLGLEGNLSNPYPGRDKQFTQVAHTSCTSVAHKLHMSCILILVSFAALKALSIRVLEAVRYQSERSQITEDRKSLKRAPSVMGMSFYTHITHTTLQIEDD